MTLLWLQTSVLQGYDNLKQLHCLVYVEDINATSLILISYHKKQQKHVASSSNMKKDKHALSYSFNFTILFLSCN